VQGAWVKDDIGLSKADQIARVLAREIRQGPLLTGDRLSSESSLMQRFAVSRNTVRKGLESLVRQGLITTRTGIGSFVTYDDERINDALGWTLALSQGSVIATRLLLLDRGSCADTASHLGASDDFLRIDRLRLHGDTGISLERSRLPWRDSFAGVLEAGLVDGSLNKTLAGLEIAIASGQQWAGVLPRLSASDASLMQRTAGEAMLHLRRLTRGADGRVIEHVVSILDPARFAVHQAF
jgi:GntR family transcriptional regulator